MKFEQITNLKKEVRIIDSTYASKKEKKEKDDMIGGEFAVNTEYHEDNILNIYDNNEDLYYIYHRSDVQFLTPLSFNGRRIAIGDEIKYNAKWCKVYDFYWHDGKWRILVVSDDNFARGCHSIFQTWIVDHRTPQDKTETIKIGDKEYNKIEVEEAIKNIQSLN